MIVDWKPCTAYELHRTPCNAGSQAEQARRNLSWVLRCTIAMGNGRPMSYGSPDDPQWWADGYELQRRAELERK